jgi:competence protein ComEC
MHSLRALYVLALAGVLAGCPAPAQPTIPTRATQPSPEAGTLPTEPAAPGEAPPPKTTWKKIDAPDDVPSTPPEAGTYRVHMIDVGTGLAILVQGHDWAMLYDAGTNDPAEKPLRVVSYLEHVLGASGDDLCVPQGDAIPKSKVKLDHVVLSHPHLDHGSALDLVVHCFDVANVWDSGRINDAVFYRDFLDAVGRSRVTTYHTAASVPSDHVVGVKGTEIKIGTWARFSEGDSIHLDETAKFTILHADAKKLSDPNQNSVVLAVELGGARMLLVGDSESGEREDPSGPVGDVEQFLIEQHAAQIHADILQVGHHGSKTSSRQAFLDAVKPKLALVSAGPKKYASVVLPDAEVLEALRKIGAEVLRTDEHDTSCPVAHRIGGDKGPGGCDSYLITIVPAAVAN